LFAPIHPGLEDPHLAQRDDVESMAGLVLRKEEFAAFETFAHGSCSQGLDLWARKACEQGGFLKESLEIGAVSFHWESLAHCLDGALDIHFT
jgi:hypothetical protein